MSQKLPDSSVDELKREVRRFLYPRFAIGLALLALMALYIFWPR